MVRTIPLCLNSCTSVLALQVSVANRTSAQRVFVVKTSCAQEEVALKCSESVRGENKLRSAAWTMTLVQCKSK